jgi:hypothetical protein
MTIRRIYKNQLVDFLRRSRFGLDKFDISEGKAYSQDSTIVEYKGNSFKF